MIKEINSVTCTMGVLHTQPCCKSNNNARLVVQGFAPLSLEVSALPVHKCMIMDTCSLRCTVTCTLYQINDFHQFSNHSLGLCYVLFWKHLKEVFLGFICEYSLNLSALSLTPLTIVLMIKTLLNASLFLYTLFSIVIFLGFFAFILVVWIRLWNYVFCYS